MPNESTSGFTDQQLQQLETIVQQASYQAASDAVGQVSSAVGSAQGDIVAALPSAVASALDSRSGSQSVVLSDEQWAFVSDSYRLQNTTLLFAALLVCALLGVLGFGLFSSGFRHD